MANKAFVTLGGISFDVIVDPLDSANNTGPAGFVTVSVLNINGSGVPVVSTVGNPDYGTGPVYGLDVALLNSDSVASFDARVSAVVRDFYGDPNLNVVLLDNKGLL